MNADAASCADSFAFFSSTPLLVQQPPAHRLLVVIPVWRDCCSWRCESSARVTYFTAPTGSTVEPARAGVDYVDVRGAVVFGVGQQRAQVAVEVLPASMDEWQSEESSPTHQRAFAIVLEAPVNTASSLRVSTEIIVEPASASKSTSLSPEPAVASSFTVVGILAAAGLMVLVAYWFRVKHCSLPRRSRAFEYKVLLLPRRDSGVSEETREALVLASGRIVKKSGVRRTARRVSSFRNWRAVADRPKAEVSDHVVPEGEEAMLKARQAAAHKERENMKGSSEDAEDDSEPEKDLRKHLTYLQSASNGADARSFEM
jgi:hypothetical protein